MKMLLLSVVGIAIVAFIAIHIIWYIKPSNIQTVAAFDQELTNGSPTIVEYYSNL